MVKDLVKLLRHAIIHSFFIQMCPCVYNMVCRFYWCYICFRRFQLLPLFMFKFLIVHHVTDFWPVKKVAKRLDRFSSADSRSRLLLSQMIKHPVG